MVISKFLETILRGLAKPYLKETVVTKLLETVLWGLTKTHWKEMVVTKFLERHQRIDAPLFVETWKSKTPKGKP